MSSRLFSEVREERGLAYEIGSGVRKFHETGAFMVDAGVDNRKLEEAVRVILKELEKTTRHDVEAGELRRAKDFYLGQLDLSLENSMEHMLWVGDGVVSYGRSRTPKEVAKKVRCITPSEVRHAAKQVFKTESLNLAVVGPVSESQNKHLEKLLSFSNN